MTDINNIYDKLFKKTFRNSKNVRDFLKRALPREIKKRLDFSSIKVEPTNYVSNEFKEGYSDITVKAKIKGKNGESVLTDIYFVLEHKTESSVKVFIQILKYMCFVWELDDNAGKALRPIIPVVFYHGKEDWNVPDSFVGQFDLDDEIKQFMLDFTYVLFDTDEWDFSDESNDEIKENVFLFTAMAVMKAAYKNDLQTIDEIFRFWYEKGFVKEKEKVLIFLAYISKTHRMPPKQLKEMLDSNKINGGELMETLAEILQKEARLEAERIGKHKWTLKGKREGLREGKRKTALEFLKNGVDVETVIKSTGFSRKEVEKMMKTLHQ